MTQKTSVHGTLAPGLCPGAVGLKSSTPRGGGGWDPIFALIVDGCLEPIKVLPCGDGEFQVKEVRNFLDELYLPSHFEATRWVKCIPIKINVLVRRARRDCLPTRHNLSRRGIPLDSVLCPLCDASVEDSQHFFLVAILPRMFFAVFVVGGTWKGSVYDASHMLSSWVGNDCCKWERVHCDKVTGKVDSLHLRGRTDDIISYDYLIGKEVITSLKDLRHLKFLDLSGNDFQGSRIPEFIGSFKQLSYLNLSNAFSGIIPPCIGNLSNLVVLDLKTITKPSLMSDDISWISGLSSLKSLDLSYVDLSKAQNRDMVFYMMPSLVKLSLSECGLTNADLGTLSNSSTTLANIKHLDLGYNHFK
nr:leucine-rich repeat protein [Tanacetum cinerariifolium]